MERERETHTYIYMYMYRLGIQWRYNMSTAWGVQPTISDLGVFGNCGLAPQMAILIGTIMINQWIYACPMFRQTDS